MSCCFESTDRDDQNKKHQLPINPLILGKNFPGQKFRDVVVTRMSSRMNPLDLIFYNQVAPARVNTVFGNFPVGCILRHEFLR